MSWGLLSKLGQLSGLQRDRECSRGAPPIPQGFYWGNFSLYTVIFSMICVPCHWASKSRRDFPLSHRVVMQTQGFFTLRFRGGHLRKFWVALEEEALPEVCGESSPVTFPDFLKHCKVACHFTTRWPPPNLFSNCYLSIYISPLSAASLLVWNYFYSLSHSGGVFLLFLPPLLCLCSLSI